MTGRLLFFQRLQKDFHHQWKVIRSVIDLTVMMYTIVPVLAIASYLYVKMWQDIHAYWLVEIPLFILIGIILLLLLAGNFRTFLREADVLFLLQRTSFLNGLKCWGFHYSLVKFMLGTAFLIVLVLPILYMAYGLSHLEVFTLFTALAAYRLLMLTLKKRITGSWSKWVGLFLLFSITLYLVSMLNSSLLMIISILTIISVYYFHTTYFIKKRKYFLQELAVEQREKMKYIKVIFGLSMELKQPSVNTASKPRFSGHTKRLFREQSKENGLLELLLKAFLRNPIYFSNYMQLLTFTIVASVVLPVLFKWIVFICYMLFLNYLTRNIFRQMLDHSFFGVVPYDKECLPVVRLRFNRWLTTPGFVLVGAFTVLFSFL